MQRVFPDPKLGEFVEGLAINHRHRVPSWSTISDTIEVTVNCGGNWSRRHKVDYTQARVPMIGIVHDKQPVLTNRKEPIGYCPIENLDHGL